MRPIPFWVALPLGLAALAGLYSLGSLGFGADIVPWLPTVVDSLIKALALPTTWIDLWLTLLRTLVGFLLAFSVGLPLGLLLGRSAWSDALFLLPVILLQSCPPLFWVIPLILILGTDGQAPAAVVFLVVLPLVVLNVREARRSLTTTLRDVFRVYAPSRWLVARELLLPALGPALKSSLVVGVVLGLKSAVLGEWFGAHTGLGRSLFRLYGFFDMPGFFALVFLFLGVAAALGLGAEALANLLFPPRRPSRARRTPWAKRGRPMPEFPPSALVLESVSFRWGGQPLLTKIGLEIAAGEIVVVTGRSGSGKTTLARLALGLLRPSGGRVVSPRRAAVLFQDDGLLNHRDVLGNALLPAWQLKTPRAEEAAQRVLAEVGLGNDLHKYPDELSGGMRKRNALARALMQEPDFFVLDEPFQNLDDEARTALWDLTFRVLAERGLGALIITHYPRELEDRPVRFWDLDAQKLM